MDTKKQFYSLRHFDYAQCGTTLSALHFFLNSVLLQQVYFVLSIDALASA